MRIIAREVEFSRGAPRHTFHAVDQADYVSIVALTPTGKIPLVRQYRPALESFSWELPAGMVGTICLKTGPATPFVEYWEDPGLTSRHLQDGWFLTPARGRLDDEGVLWIGE